MLTRRSGILYFVLLSAVFYNAQCQDQSAFNQFYLNPYLLNPSYAGIDGQPSASLLYRKQWMTIDGAPAITSLTIQAPLKGRVSGAVNVANESIGFFKQSAVSFSAAYYVALREQLFLRFGISAGASWNTVDMKKLDGIDDPALSGVMERSVALTGSAGLSLHSKTFNFGVVLPALFSPVYVSKDAFDMKEIEPFQALILHASNRFYFNGDKDLFEPYIVYRINNGLPSQLEVAGIIHLNHLLWAGASYRQAYGASALGGIKLGNALAIGGAYSIQQQSVDRLNSPSFEASLSYLFGSVRKGGPVYSFVNDAKPKERRILANRRPVATTRGPSPARTAPAKPSIQGDKQAQQNKPGPEKAPTPLTEPPALTKPDQHNVEPSLKERPAPQPVPSKQEVAPEVATREEESPSQDTAVAKEESPSQDTAAAEEEIQRITPVAETPPKEVRHETVKRGDHPEELQAAEYVIAGTFRSAANAKHFSDGLRSLDFPTKYGYVTEKELWYVYLFKSPNAAKAKAEQARVSKLFLLKDAWLLTVQP